MHSANYYFLFFCKFWCSSVYKMLKYCNTYCDDTYCPLAHKCNFVRNQKQINAKLLPKYFERKCYNCTKNQIYVQECSKIEHVLLIVQLRYSKKKKIYLWRPLLQILYVQRVRIVKAPTLK
jgi:hypothetical protein